MADGQAVKSAGSADPFSKSARRSAPTGYFGSPARGP
jgi:hypothetical protein